MNKNKILILSLGITAIVLFIVFTVLLVMYINSKKNQEDINPNGNNSVLIPTGDFEVDIFRQSVKESNGGNIVVSPLSIRMAMSMATEGAYGDTLNELNEVLGLSDSSKEYFKNVIEDVSQDEEVIFNIANSTWAREGIEFKQTYIDVLEEYYQADTKVLDFTDPKSVDVINAWVSRKTNDKIQKILESISAEQIMFLINAIYFNADWTKQFNEEFTTKKDFNLIDGSKIQTDAMYMSSDFQYLENDEFQAVELPYGESKRFVMRVFLPKEGKDINEFVTALTLSKVREWGLGFERMEGDLQLPKFKTEYSTSLKDTLMSLGIVEAFDPTAAHFDRMINLTGAFNVYIGDVIHKTYIDVSERGTEAAAVTMVAIEATSMPVEEPERFEMIVDRPFLFTIEDTENDLILFMGLIVDPSQ